VDVTFFAEKEGCDLNSFEEIPENSILGGGRFTKNQIGDLLGCFKCSASALSNNLWILPTNFSENLAVIDDEELKNVAVNWSDEHSWVNTNVNSMDLAGHLLELKYAYLSHSNKRVFALFE
jgi:hypothetical protein